MINIVKHEDNYVIQTEGMNSIIGENSIQVPHEAEWDLMMIGSRESRHPSKIVCKHGEVRIDIALHEGERCLDVRGDEIPRALIEADRKTPNILSPCEEDDRINPYDRQIESESEVSGEYRCKSCGVVHESREMVISFDAGGCEAYLCQGGCEGSTGSELEQETLSSSSSQSE